MAVQVQHRRGTAAAHATFIGAPAELTWIEDEQRFAGHNGATAGGIKMARLDEVTSEVQRAVGNADFSFQITDRLVVPNAVLSAPRTGTLPAANSVAAGRTISFFDALPALNGANVLTVARSGSDTINGANSYACSQPRGRWDFISDGTSKWFVAQEKQPLDATLTALAGVTVAANKLIYATGSDAFTTTDLTAAGRALLDDPDAAAQRTTLGAQAALGFTPINKAGDSGIGVLSTSGVTAIGNTAIGGSLRSGSWGALTQYLAIYSNASAGPLSGDLTVHDTINSQQAWFSFKATGAFHVPGALSKGSGTFLIDHPLDPFNKDLAHGFVEAPRYDLIYRGTTRLVGGSAFVDIDAASDMSAGTFAALTTNAVVSSIQNQEGFARLRPGPITDGSFEIICEDAACGDLVSWVVIAERNDPFVRSGLDPNTDENGRFIPEREKDDADA